MRQRAVIVAPGRGTYNREELGYLRRHHADRADLIAGFDAYRVEQGQETLSALDGATRFSGARHTRGDNAAALIHACAVADFQAVAERDFDIVGVTGNSMGWYVALACAGALSMRDGMHLVNTMGRLMHEQGAGGQLIYPIVDETWCEVPGRREEIMARVASINARAGAALALSIDLGGMLVLAGDEAGLGAFETSMPRIDGRFPMRLPNHAAFHTSLVAPVARAGQDALPLALFAPPRLPLVDGRGGLWWPGASDPAALRAYTLGQQVSEPYDFAAAIRVAARELMPDVFIVLGPGTTLGSSVAQSLIRIGWRGWRNRADFDAEQARQLRLISMGRDDQRP